LIRAHAADPPADHGSDYRAAGVVAKGCNFLTRQGP
jgi:hypothetical protein